MKRVVAVALGVIMIVGTVGAIPAGAAKTKSVTLNALFFSEGANGPSGGTNKFTVEYNPKAKKGFRVGFSQDEVGGTGAQWEAAGWNAAAVATLLTGSKLSGVSVNFEVNGRIDGPSAGALMTVGLLSLIRGDKIKSDVTMTGTINPDGTVGPVGGIPYKIDGVKKAHKKRMLIPEGQRNSADNDGNLVDIVTAAKRKGISVTEVGDVYEAYKAFTGKSLPRPREASSVALSEDAYQDIKAKVKSQLADFQASAGEFNSLAPAIQQALTSITNQANDAKDRAEKLSDDGLQAGAYDAAIESAALANAAVKTGQSLQILLTQGGAAFKQQILASTAVSGKVEAAVDDLKNFRPKSVSDAAALINAYGSIIDAISLSNQASDLLDQADATTEAGVTNAVLGAVYYELAGTLVDNTKDVLDVGRGLGGAKVSSKVDLPSTAAFFRKAAEANLNAFDSLILEPEASKAGMSADALKARFAGADEDYALSQSAVSVLEGGLDDYLGDAKTASYAKLGGAVSLYARSSQLLTKYYSLGQLNDDLEVTGISNEKALTSALELGQGQVKRSVGVLRSKKVEPALVVASYETAGVDREGDASDKLDALGQYLSAYVNARVLAYLGGFQTSTK
jgi:hypothetical protein